MHITLTLTHNQNKYDRAWNGACAPPTFYVYRNIKDYVHLRIPLLFIEAVHFGQYHLPLGGCEIPTQG